MSNNFIEDDTGTGDYLDNGVDDWDRRNSDSEDSDGDSESPEDYYSRTGKTKPKKKKGQVSKKKAISTRDDYSGAAKKKGNNSRKEEKDAFEKGRKSLMAGGKKNDKYSKSTIHDYRNLKNNDDDFMNNLMKGLEEPSTSSSTLPNTPSSNLNSSNRKRKSDYTSYGDGSFSKFRQTSTTNRGGQLSSPSSGGPSGSDDHPSSDGIQPQVHITGSDTLLGMPLVYMTRKISKIMMVKKEEDDSMDLDEDVKLGLGSDDDDDDDSFSIKAPGAFTGKQKLVNASSVKIAKTSTTTTSKPIISNNVQVEEDEKKSNSRAKLMDGSWKKVDQGFNLISTVDEVDSSVSLPVKGPQGRRKQLPPPKVVESSSAPVQTRVNAIESDGSLKFFWYDHVEVDERSPCLERSKIEIVGNSLVVRWLSKESRDVCSFYQEVERRFMERSPPKLRPKKKSKEEFEAIKEKKGIKNTMCKWVKRKYAFELPGVPSEADYLKVRYGFDEPVLPLNVEGSTIERVFGTNTNAFELFVVKNGIMGPCWLNVKNVTPISMERFNNIILVLMIQMLLLDMNSLVVSLDVLLHRMKELNVPDKMWNKLGKVKRKAWPRLSQGFNVPLLSGRLIADLSSETGKGESCFRTINLWNESIINCVTWSLTEMVNTVLDQERVDIDPDDTASYFDSTALNCDRLMEFLRHCELDSFFQMAINCKVQMLPLTKQLTNLAGNNWARTLNGGRAERNEYILLHEFHRQKYVCPDKIGRKAAAEAKALLQAQRENENENEAGGSSTKNPSKKKYQGGLVFDPKRGLYDRYVLVMDFNSLYPSIIQEYNIDFTTVDRSDDDLSDVDKIPDIPSSDVQQGVLPRLIAQLVNRRREVKKLMKSGGKDVKPSTMKAYDIKQLALKLTATRCREILTHTKELAISLNLDVIYGDTDSVMINTNATELSEAMKIGNDFKKTVNDKYRLLEIDIDAVFQRMLLLQRKNVSNYVLGQILSGAATETVVSQIHEYLTEIGNQVRESKIPLEDFIIYKRLGKNPEDYPDKKGQPHVQVALRMKAKFGFQSAQADRAFHPDDLRKQDSDKRIDFEHYLSLQILPPIERLCDSIEGTDRSRLAQCLGLDPDKYKVANSNELKSNDWELKTVDSLIPDEERYSKCQELKIRCLKCRKLSTLKGFLISRKSNLKKE
ncbi:hypothetical protein L7F22_048684 [Adiantum nelumboides]|nr:hypothetical protein [Adiantum nelumboides]